MRESCTYGSVRGTRGNSRSYRDLVPVVLTHSLDKQELAFGRRFIGNAVGDAWQDLMSFADGKLVAMVGTTGLDGEFAPQHEIMVRALAVIMPGNDVAISQREDTDLDIRADGDRFHVFHLIIRHP